MDIKITKAPVFARKQRDSIAGSVAPYIKALKVGEAFVWPGANRQGANYATCWCGAMLDRTFTVRLNGKAVYFCRVA